MKQFLLSNIALVIGVLSLISGLTNPSWLLIAGIMIILGTLAYQSAKKRKLGLAKDTIIKKVLEIISIIIVLFLALAKENWFDLMYEDPLPYLIIPVWVLGVYLYIVFLKPKK